MRKGHRQNTDATCDRCGVRETVRGQGVLPEGWTVLRPERFTNKGIRKAEIIDLCEECSTLLDMWVKRIGG